MTNPGKFSGLACRRIARRVPGAWSGRGCRSSVGSGRALMPIASGE